MRNRRQKRTTKSSSYNTLKAIKFILLILILICFVSFISSYFKHKDSFDYSKIADSSNSENLSPEEITEDQEALETEETTHVNQPTPKDTSITMAFTGDIMCHNTMYNDAYNATSKTYDFAYFFDDVKYYLQTADITVGNLETTFAGASVGYSSYPTFNTPESLAKTLKNIGFDVVSTANNHCMDKGYSGLVSTLFYLDEADISHTGTYASQEDQNTILIKNVKGINIAFLSFTYGTNGIKIPTGKEYSVNLIDEETMLSQLNLAKAQNPDLICVCMHWGNEYQTTPSSSQKELAEFLLKNGTDIIIGNHPHVPQSMELKTVTLDDGSTKEGFVIYSLGNFMADQNKAYTRDSLILNLKLTKSGKTGEVVFNSATYTPTYIYKNTSVFSKKFKILDIQSTIESYNAGYDKSIGATTYKTLSTELANIKKIVGEEIIK